MTRTLGSSYSGLLKPLSQEEKQIRNNLEKHVKMLSDTIGERHIGNYLMTTMKPRLALWNEDLFEDTLSQFHPETEKRSGESCKSCQSKFRQDPQDKQEMSSTFPDEKWKDPFDFEIDPAMLSTKGRRANLPTVYCSLQG